MQAVINNNKAKIEFDIPVQLVHLFKNENLKLKQINLIKS